MKKRRSLKRFLVVLLLLLAVAGAAWTGLWYLVSGRLIAHVLTWEEARRAEGWTISHAPPRRAGWPMAAGVRLAGLSVSGGRAYLPGGVTWTAGGLTLALDIRHPNALFLGATGRQSLVLGQGPALTFQAKRFTGRAALLAGDRLGLMQFEVRGLLAGWPTGAGRKPVAIHHLAAAVRVDGGADAAGEAVALAAELHGIIAQRQSAMHRG